MTNCRDVVAKYSGFPDHGLAPSVIYTHNVFGKDDRDGEMLGEALDDIVRSTADAQVDTDTAHHFASFARSSPALTTLFEALVASELRPNKDAVKTSPDTVVRASRLLVARNIWKTLFGEVDNRAESIHTVVEPIAAQNMLARLEATERELEGAGRPVFLGSKPVSESALEPIDLDTVVQVAACQLDPAKVLALRTAGFRELRTMGKILVSTRRIARMAFMA